MKYFVLIAIIGTLAFGLAGCKYLGTADEEPLLLLDDTAKKAGAPEAAAVANNQTCFVCHGNFVGDKFIVSHAKAGIGCPKCHGASDAHTDDEDNITPPNIMYTKQQVNPMCSECHPQEKVSRKAHNPVFARATPEGKRYCTDCHSKHKANRRSTFWDKATGELLVDK